MKRLKKLRRGVARRWNYWRWNRWPYLKVRFREWRQYRYRRTRRSLEALGAGKVDVSPTRWAKRHPRRAVGWGLAVAFMTGSAAGLVVGQSMGQVAFRAERRALRAARVDWPDRSTQRPDAADRSARRGVRPDASSGWSSRLLATIKEVVELDQAQEDSITALIFDQQRRAADVQDSLFAMIADVLRPDQQAELNELPAGRGQPGRLLRLLANPSG